jgi:hypothetical protein
MKSLNLSVNRLTLELHVPATRIGEIVDERRRVTAHSACGRAGLLNDSCLLGLAVPRWRRRPAHSCRSAAAGSIRIDLRAGR